MLDGSNEAKARAELYAALSRAMGGLRALRKDGSAQGYTYTSDAEIASAARDAMAAEGLTAGMPVRVEPLEPLTIKTRNGDRVVYRALYTWRVGHAMGGSIDVQSEGSAMVTGDKAAYVAMTGARKNMLTSLLSIERTDDPEAEGGLSAEDCAALLRVRGLEPAAVDAWLVSRKQPTIDRLSPALRQRLVDRMSTDEGKAQIIVERGQQSAPPAKDPTHEGPAGMGEIVTRLQKMRLSAGMVDRYLESKGKPPIAEHARPLDLLERLEQSEEARYLVASLESNRAEALAQLGCDEGRARKIAKKVGGDDSVLGADADTWAQFYAYLLTDEGARQIKEVK